MYNLQQSINENSQNSQTSKSSREAVLRRILFLNYFALIITFALNFLGLPLLKYHYLFHLGLTFFAVLMFDLPVIFPVVLTMLFVEGQGRIIWEYQSWARVIFDSLILIAIVKVFITRKKILNLKITPPLMAILFLLHFGWYCIEFFNVYSSTYFSALSSTKIYIYPFFLFFAFSQSDFQVESKRFDKSIIILAFILALEVALNYFQFQQKEAFLIQISAYYSKLIKNDAFAGIRFRPFATSFIPGALSMYLYLTVGFLFFKKLNWKKNFFRMILIAASIHALILCQVRSALIKYLLVIIFIQLGQMFYVRLKSKMTLLGFFMIIILLFGIQLTPERTAVNTKDEGFNYALERILTLTDPGKLKVTRLNLREFGESLVSNFSQYPLGLGPGSSGAAANAGQEDAQDKRIHPVIWSGDNLYISLFLDFGFGAIFYIALVLYIPIHFFRFLIVFYKKKLEQDYQTLLICFSAIAVIVIGNWGFLGLPYNPESFFFWFFAALGFHTIYKYKKLNGSFDKSHALTSPAQT